VCPEGMGAECHWGAESWRGIITALSATPANGAPPPTTRPEKPVGAYYPWNSERSARANADVLEGALS
jgi:hypothetical protein